MIRDVLMREVAMKSEYVEERNGGYYAAGTRISLDSVVYSFERGEFARGAKRGAEDSGIGRSAQ